MYYLGLFGGHGPNPSAALIKGNKLIAFAEEERFIRIKNAPSSLPINSIIFCLKKAKIKARDLKKIGIAWDCKNYSQNQHKFLKKIKSQFNKDNNKFNDLHEQKLLNAFNPTMITESLKFGLAKSNEFIDTRKIEFIDHHLCHAASSYFASNFNKSLIFTIDGSGEENCTVEWIGKNSSLTKINSFKLPNTLGGYYGTFTEFLGFKSDSEEGKLMGLAPYGKFNKKIQDKLSYILDFDNYGNYKINPEFRFYGERSFNSKFTNQLIELIGPNRSKSEKITQYHKDLAFNVQWRLEKAISNLISNRIKREKIFNVCIAGGVGMNCKMNGVISQLQMIENLYVQPASSDNGTALGAACILASKNREMISNIMPHAYWGPSYKDIEIENAIKESKLNFDIPDNIYTATAQYLKKGLIVGWMQGRSEIGARSLGARSILANPLISNMRDKLNLEVKHREKWRPFCPSMTDKGFKKYFGNKKPANFMIIAYHIKKEFKKIFSAAVHVDGSVRPQSVSKKDNKKFYYLLKEFGKLTGHEILINTSFNIQGEPIVETPRDALRCFGGTGIDILVMGNYLIKKPNVK